MIKYDCCGRMVYNPELHFNSGTPWTEEDLEYLINWYDIIGAEEMSLALGRTEMSISNKANTLRNRGIMRRKSGANCEYLRLLKCDKNADYIWRAYA